MMILLFTITTGEVADESINVDKFIEIGESVVRNLQGLNIFDNTFHRKNAIKNMMIMHKLIPRYFSRDC